MIDFKKTLGIIRIPMIITVLLTCLGILLNAINIPIIIFGWYAFVFFVLGICLLWVGYSSGTKGLSVVDTGINGIILWLIPGSVGLTINGLLSLFSAALWGALVGFEIIVAFLIGAVVIAVLLAIGSVGAFIIANIGRFVGQMTAKKK